MKTRFTWLGIVAAILLSVSAFFIACDKDLNSVVKYRGQVVYINTTTPFPDLTVKVTDGHNTHCQTQTDAGGAFELNVRISEIDNNYYLLAGDSTCVPKKVNLGGFGQAEVDLGVIEVEGPTIPVVVTDTNYTVMAEDAVCGGEVQFDGRMPVTARGICYGTEQHPTIDGLHTTDGSGLGKFSSELKRLNHNTTYYARAYATNKMGTAYGKQIKFTTELGVPTVITDSVYRVTVRSARCKGHVESDGGYPIIQRGTCWSRYPDPTLDDDFTNDGSGIGEFTSALSNLHEDTKYYVRTYATNSTATIYGEQISITTLDGLATVAITDTSTTATSIVIRCEVSDDAGYSITERGICYSTINSEPSIEDNKKASGRGKGSYSVSISELSAFTTYHVRAYAINEFGVAYSSILDVTTKNGVATISINSASNITALTASCSMKVTNTNGAILQKCGICWSTNQNPTINDDKVIGGDAVNTDYVCNMTNLIPSTRYYVRAFAVTDITTSYSKQVTFKTTVGLPSVTTSTTTATSTTIISGGKITNNGGYAIEECGVCYSATNATPTIDDMYEISEVLSNTFTVTITYVDFNTTYYVRAYAINRNGIAYGSVKTVTTGDGLPHVITTVIGENVTSTTATGGGQITSDGGDAVMARGVCWSTFPNPTIYDSKTTDGSGMGYFTSNITGIDLTSSKTYYVRAYATNINGTSYGEQVLVSKENLDYKNLFIFQYDAHTYRVYTALGVMTWKNGNVACESLKYGGYEDWFMPNNMEIQAMLTAANLWGVGKDAGDFGGLSSIWSFSAYSEDYKYYYLYHLKNSSNESMAGYYWEKFKTDMYSTFSVVAVRRD